jgi:hypothetical protein
MVVTTPTIVRIPEWLRASCCFWVAFIAVVTSSALHALPKPLGPIDFQVAIDESPISTVEANATQNVRAALAIQWAACGREHHVVALTEGNDHGEGLTRALIGKVRWINERPGEICETSVWVSEGQVNNFEQRFKRLFPAARGSAANASCNLKPIDYAPTGNPENWVEVTYRVDAECMRVQIENAILRMTPGLLGTSGIPCVTLTAAGGDYDMSLRHLVRLYYLDTPSRGMRPAVSAVAKAHIVNRLFTTSGPLEPDSYSLFGCGNSEQDQGTPQERADEESFWDNVADTLGDSLKWLGLFLALFSVAGLLIALGGVIGTTIVVAGIVVGVTLGPTLVTTRIPETENHLFMINTSRYLINEVLIRQLDNAEDQTDLKNQQQEIEEWLLKRLQRIAREDYVEYNSKPYSRFTQTAILNLHDFAPTDETGNSRLRTASRIVLDLTATRFALSNSQGRRNVSYRRLLKVVRDNSIDLRDDAVQLVNSGDYQSVLFAYFTGIVSHFHRIEVEETASGTGISTPLRPRLLAGKVPVHLLSESMVDEWIYPATSSYRPSETILGWTFDRSRYFQRVNGPGLEISAGAQSYVITAGGRRAKVSEQLNVPTIPTPESLALKAALDGLGQCQDIGTGAPTMFIPAAGAGVLQMRLEKFVRFEGGIFWLPRNGEEKRMCRDDAGSEAEFRSRSPSATREADEVNTELANLRHDFGHDYNTCVYKGFACGVNLVVPDKYVACAQGANTVLSTINADGVWRFIDSQECEFLKDSKNSSTGFFLAIYEVPCTSSGDTSAPVCRNWGLLDVLHNDESIRLNRTRQFDAFKRRVLANENELKLSIKVIAGLLPFMAPRWFISGAVEDAKYVTSEGHRLTFTINSNQVDRKNWDIKSINGVQQLSIDKWRFFEGDALTTVGELIYHLHQSDGNLAVRYDFSRWDAPRIN